MNTQQRRRSVLSLIGLIPMFGLLLTMAPRDSRAGGLCYDGYINTIDYYSDASMTNVIGHCVENECAGTTRCYGQTSDYSALVDQQLCERCL
jgi:hypothetical protein